MIISASRRTDIPAFYSQWFMNRIRAGYCTVPNPFNRTQVSYVSLKPEDVDIIVFWTRNPAPLLPHLHELDDRGYRYYFQYTVLNYPRSIDQKCPPIRSAIDTFQKLAALVGVDRVIWRYDPIIFTNEIGLQFHLENYQKIAEKLNGYTHRSVISVVDVYRKASKRITDLKNKGIEIVTYNGKPNERFSQMLTSMVRIACENNMEIRSCAEEIDLFPYGVEPGKCIDDQYIRRVFGNEVNRKKDPSQRAECGCVVSKDIGVYDTCLFGCQYCYATSSFDRAQTNHEKHDPGSPSLIGWYDAPKPIEYIQPDLFKGVDNDRAT